ncbi:MAG TPA: RNA methyltransferase [Terriglobales bacterium]|nr:RNA methyltransferase [Terriglobales bacterium]
MTNGLDNLRVVLVATRNPLNIGAAARAMSNFGVMRLRVVNPYEKAFREARSAVGAAELLAKAEKFDDVAEAIADCKLVVGTTAAAVVRDLQHNLVSLEDGARAIKRRLKTGPVAILFGSERYGLSNEELSHCHWLMRAPTREEHGSMNLGQAVAVCLYELVRGRKTAAKKTLGRTSGKKEIPAATSGEIERLTQKLLEVLVTSGYVKPQAVDAEEKLRRLIRRAKLNSNDAEVLLGMMRQIAWKIGG